MTLRVLRREPAPHVMTPSALHETLVLSPGGMTKILKQLEARGSSCAAATPPTSAATSCSSPRAGKTKIGAVQKAVREFDGALLERTLAERDQQRLAQLLRKLLVSLEPQRSAAARRPRRAVVASRGVARLLARRASDRLADRAARRRGVAPIADLHPLAFLEILVVLEEVLDLLQRDRRHVACSS